MKLKIWDLPVRLFHWSLVIFVVLAVVEAKQDNLDQHMVYGQAVLTLILFRVFWGFWGTKTARFSSFLVSFKAVKQHFEMMRGKIPYRPTLGHNPLGGLMVASMLLVLLVQGCLGLFSFDQVFTYGPLAHLIDDDQASTMAGYHKSWVYGVFALIALHVFAIGFYKRFKGDNLLTPMITGMKDLGDEDRGDEGEKEKPHRKDGSPFVYGVRFFVSSAMAYGLVWYVVNKV